MDRPRSITTARAVILDITKYIDNQPALLLIADALEVLIASETDGKTADDIADLLRQHYITENIISQEK